MTDDLDAYTELILALMLWQIAHYAYIFTYNCVRSMQWTPSKSSCSLKWVSSQ